MPVRRPLTVERILAWCDEYRARTGRWPSRNSGPVQGAPGENWNAIDQALADGRRGLSGGSSLARLLAQCRGHRTGSPAGTLTVAQVLAWADLHFRRTGRWPTAASGPVLDAPGEHWRAINSSLREGYRGLPRGGSLALQLRSSRAGRARDQALNQRDREIAAARSRGETYRAIAARYGLTHQRVQQIVRDERRRCARKGGVSRGGRADVKGPGRQPRGDPPRGMPSSCLPFLLSS
jgi:hypothetical protein